MSKGVVAKNDDLQKCFGTSNKQQIISLILNTGSVQISEKERNADISRVVKDVAQIIHMKCVNTETQKPFPISVIEEALKEIHFSAKPGKNPKQQALAVIPVLSDKLPISRTKMRISVVLPKECVNPFLSSIEKSDIHASRDSQDWGVDGSSTIIYVVDPGYLRPMIEFVANSSKGKGSVDVVDLQVHTEN